MHLIGHSRYILSSEAIWEMSKEIKIKKKMLDGVCQENKSNCSVFFLFLKRNTIPIW